MSVLVVATLGATVGACTPGSPPSDPEPTHLETETPRRSAPPSVSPAPTGTADALADGVKPERPSVIDGPPTTDAADAVAGYFVQLFPYSLQTNDVAEFARISHPDCVFCGSVKSDVAGQVERAEHTVGGAISVASSSSTEVVPGQHFAVSLTIEEAPSHVENKFGVVVQDNAEPAAYAVDMAVVVEDGQWFVREVSSRAVTS